MSDSDAPRGVTRIHGEGGKEASVLFDDTFSLAWLAWGSETGGLVRGETRPLQDPARPGSHRCASQEQAECLRPSTLACSNDAGA